jgi:hypothetical protein
MLRKLCAMLTLAGVVLILVSAATIVPRGPALEDLVMIIRECQVELNIALAVLLFSATISATSALLVADGNASGVDSPAPQAIPEIQPEPLPEPKPEIKAEIKPEPVKVAQPDPEPEPVPVPEAPKIAPAAAFQILSLLQKEGRLLDFLMEDISEIDDEALGGGIRPIHEGCRKILTERLIIEPVLDSAEGSDVEIKEADPNAIKLTGNVPPNPPYKGVLVHRGWKLKECKLPDLVSGWTGNVVAPAEVEIQ